MHAVIDPTDAGARLRKQGWLALVAMLALALMPALSRLGAPVSDLASGLPRVVCSVMPMLHGVGSIPGTDAQSRRGDPRQAVCPECLVAGLDHLLSAASSPDTLLVAGSMAPSAVPTTATDAERAPSARARSPPRAAGPSAA